MKKTLVVMTCLMGSLGWGLGDARAWSPPTSPVPTQEDATLVRNALADCSTDADGKPDAYTVWVYRDAPFQGTCKILLPGFYPSSSHFGIGNDAMSSIRIGAGVRARLFEHGGYGGASITVTSDTAYLGNFPSWNDVVSSMRVELANRSQSCSDVRSGEMALFQHAYYQGDCVVLPVKTWSGLPRTYADPGAMGIANDSISSLKYRSDFNRTAFFWDANLDPNHAACYTAYPNTDVAALPARYGQIIGPNDQISSVGPVADPYVCGRF